MSPLQRSILSFLMKQNKGLPLHEIAKQISHQSDRLVLPGTIPGAFSHRRTWLESSSGKLNDTSLISISEEGRQALTAYEEGREANHPMGKIKAGRFFVFIEEHHVIRRHTMVITNVADAEEAERIARDRCDRGEYPAAMSIAIDRSFKVKPVREGHGA